MDISQLMCFRELFRQKVLISIVLSNFRSECHHLSGWSMARHVGVAQVHIILVDGYDAVHDVLYLRLSVALSISPLAVDDIFLCHFGAVFH